MSERPPVVLLTIDTLRQDRLTESCFPNSMPILEDDFARFTNAYSHGNATPLAFPGIITGQPVVGNGDFQNEAEPIAEMFGEDAAGFSNNGHLTAERGYDRGFGLFHDQRPPGQSRSVKKQLKSNKRVRESQLMLKAYRAMNRFTGTSNDGPATLSKPASPAATVTNFVQEQTPQNDFVWGHYMDSHKPFLPSFAVDGPEIDRTDEEIAYLNSYEREEDPADPDDMAFLEALYESNIRAVDQELFRLLREFRTQSWYEDALIVIVADHGELFGEHGYMFHPMHVDPFDELIQTPLLVKYPHNTHAGESFDHLVQHADIRPTIAEAIGSQRAAPEGTHPLTDRTQRHIISKSNTAIRLTEDEATVIRRRDGTTEQSGEISETGRERFQDADYPRVLTSSGVIKGVEDMERQRRLEALGYR